MFSIEDEVPQDLDCMHNQKFVHQEQFIVGHLNSPIVDEDCNFLLNYQKFYCRRHSSIKSFLNKNYPSIKNIYHSDCHPWECVKSSLINDYNFPISLHTRFKEINNHEINELTRLIDVSAKSLEIQKSYYSSSVINSSEIKIKNERDIRLLKDFLKNKRNLNVLKIHYINKLKVEEIKERISYKKINRGSFLKISEDFYVENDISIYTCKKHKDSRLIPTNLLLGVLDKIQVLFSLSLYWMMSDWYNKYNNSILTIGLYTIDKLQELQSILKEDFFKIMAIWESLVIGNIVKDQINDLGFEGLYNEIIKEIDSIVICYLEKESIEYHNLINREHIQNILLLNKFRIGDDNQNDDIDHLNLELIGINKLFGHPKLEIKKGLKNIRKIACKKIKINYHVVKESANMFKKLFAKQYFLKYKSLPKIHQLNSDNPLCKMFQMNKYSESIVQRIPLDHWTEIKFFKTFHYDYSPDTLELLKDSALALDKDQWFEDYDHCAFKNLYNKNKPSRINKEKRVYKRTILRFLEGAEHETKRKIKRLNKGIMDVKTDSYATYCPKEGELKSEGGRCFLKQNFPQRLAQVSMEKNVADNILNLFKETTMTLREIELIKRESNILASLNNNVQVINLDLSKWNLTFRHELVTDFGKIIDELFGFSKLYKNCHLWFITSTFTSNNRLCPPDYDKNFMPVPGDYCHIHHLGGSEGMKQKLWTIITFSIIRTVAYKLRLRIEIMGQGDNQVIFLKFKPHQIENQVELRQKFLENLESTFSSVGLKLKLKETWFSKRLFEYGKVRFLNGKAVSDGTKKIRGLIPDINDGVNSIPSNLNNISTITESCSKFDFCPDPSFFVNSIEILIFLQRKKVISLYCHDYNESKILKVLFFPSCFGGLNLSDYFSHFVRGMDDKLSYWIGLYIHIKQNYSYLFRELIKCVTLKPDSKIDYSRLIEDIFTLNLRPLPSIEIENKKKILLFLENYPRLNTEVKNLFNPNITMSLSQLVKILMTMDPFVPSLAYELLKNSNQGILLSLRNRLNNIQTINRIYQSQSEVSFLAMTIKCNHDWVKTVKSKLKVNNIPCLYTSDFFDKHNCPTYMATKIRKEHWKIDSIGNTKPNVLHQISILPLDECTKDQLDKAIIVEISNDFLSSKLGYRVGLGPYSGYVGSITTEKIKRPVLQVEFQTNFVKAVKKLYTIRSWVLLMSSVNLMALTDALILEKIELIPYPIDFEKLDEWCGQIYGGNLLHRLLCELEKCAALINHLPTLATHFRICTNNLINFMKGGKDYTIHFQLIFLYIQTLLLTIKLIDVQLKRQYACILDCEECTKEITGFTTEIKPFDNNHISKLSENMGKFKIFDRYKKNLPGVVENFPISTPRLNEYLSIFLGRRLGEELDFEYYEKYSEETTIYNPPELSNSQAISITEFRNCNFELLIVGIIQSSLTFLQLIKSDDHWNNLRLGGRCFPTLANLILNSKNLERFLYFFNIKTDNHTDLINSFNLSKLIIPFLVDYCKVNIKKLTYLSLNYKFKNDNHQIFSLLKSELCKNIKYHTLEEDFKGTLISNPTLEIEESEIITYWRNRLSSKGPALKVFEKIEERIFKIPDNFNYDIFHSSKLEFFESYNNLSGKNLEQLRIKQLHHLVRPISNISSSPSKILEIILHFSLDKINLNEGVIACLADGSGSITNLMAHLFPFNSLIYNTLITSDDKRTNIDILTATSIVQDKCQIQNRFLDELKHISGETNILHDDYIKKLEFTMSGKFFRFLIIDAESEEIKTGFVFLIQYLRIFKNYSTRGSVFIIKLFISIEDIDLFQLIIQKYRKGFKFNLYRGITFNHSLFEHYLICERLDRKQETIIKITRFYDLELDNISSKDHLSSIIKNLVFFKENIMKYTNTFECLLHTDTFSGLIQNKKICSILCNKLELNLYSAIMDLFDDTFNLEEFESSLMYSKIIKRDLGFHRICHDILLFIYIISSIRNKVFSLSDLLYSLSSIKGILYLNPLTEKELKISEQNYVSKIKRESRLRLKQLRKRFNVKLTVLEGPSSSGEDSQKYKNTKGKNIKNHPDKEYTSENENFKEKTFLEEQIDGDDSKLEKYKDEVQKELLNRKGLLRDIKVRKFDPVVVINNNSEFNLLENWNLFKYFLRGFNFDECNCPHPSLMTLLNFKNLY